MVGAAHAGSLAGAQQAARTPLEAQGERQAVLTWLAQHRVNDMLCALLETLCVERPANPHQYIVDWMCAQYPAAIKVSVGAAQSVGPLSTHVEVEKEPAEEDDEFETEEKPTSGAPDMSIQMAMSLNRNTVSRRRRAVSAESVDPDKIKSLYTRKLHAKPAGVRARLLESVSKNFLFYTLDAEQKGVLLDAMFERRCEAGETVIAQGAEGDNFYLVYEGACDVYLAKDGAESCVLHCVEGDTFGELALLYNAPRSASVRTATACTLYAVDRFTFKSIMMETTMSKRETYESFLAKVPLLSSLTPNERRTVADALKPTTYRDGEAIIHQNEVRRARARTRVGAAAAAARWESVRLAPGSADPPASASARRACVRARRRARPSSWWRRARSCARPWPTGWCRSSAGARRASILARSRSSPTGRAARLSRQSATSRCSRSTGGRSRACSAR